MTSFAPDSVVLNRKLPLWYQVSQSLRASILGRSPRDPLRLPTEEQLAGHYGVSVLTMRQALKELEDEGLITRHRRRGTFIEPHARRGAPVRLLGSVDAIVAQQSGMKAELLDHGPAAVPSALTEFFPELAELAMYHRLRCDEKTGEPTNHARNYVRPELAARIDADDLARWPMTKVLRDVVGVDISRITDTVEPARGPGDGAAAAGAAAQPDPALHGHHLRHRGPGARRGGHPLPGRPLLLHGHPGRHVRPRRPVVRCPA